MDKRTLLKACVGLFPRFCFGEKLAIKAVRFSNGGEPV